MLDLVEKITLNAYKVTPEDVEGLRGNGFTDEEILDIVLASALRSFISKTLDATGAEIDADQLHVEPVLDRLAGLSG